MKTTFVNSKDMTKLAFSSKERALVHEGDNEIPPQHSCGGLKKGSGDMNLKNRHSPSLRESNKKINQGKKKNNIKWYSSNKTSLFCHYCKKIGHNIVSCCDPDYFRHEMRAEI
jgi:hypothetical protein